MARVRICKFCGYPNRPDQLFCQGERGGKTCGTPTKGFALVDEDNIEAPAELDVNTSQIEQGTVREHVVGDGLERAFLDCPWGELPIIGNAINIGRSTDFSEQAMNFADYMTVSGEHAVISLSGGVWIIKDVGSTNGTFVNGIQLTPNDEVSVQDGDQINFSKSFRAVFKVESQDS